MNMSEVEMHNAKVEEINRACKTLIESKPTIPTRYYTSRNGGSGCFSFRVQSDRSIDTKGAARGIGETRASQNNEIVDMRAFAACLVKATGPITQEELDAVVVE